MASNPHRSSCPPYLVPDPGPDPGLRRSRNGSETNLKSKNNSKSNLRSSSRAGSSSSLPRNNSSDANLSVSNNTSWDRLTCTDGETL